MTVGQGTGQRLGAVELKGALAGASARERESQRTLEVAARRAGIHVELRDALARLPTAQALTQRVAYYLTADLPHPAGLPLLDLCLRTGLAYYRDSVAAGEKNRTRLFMEFVAGLFTPLPAVVEIAVRAGGDAWDPLKGEALTAWRDAHPGTQMIPGVLVESIAATPPRAIRAALAFPLINPANLAHLPPEALTTITDYPDR